jgi:hypothetical protein
MSDPVDTLTGKLAATEAEVERGLAYAHQIEEAGRALTFEIEKLLGENQRLWSRLETRTAEANAYAVKNERLRATADPEPCGHADHPGKFTNDWTDKERGAFLLGQKMARTVLAENQQLRALSRNEIDVMRVTISTQKEWIDGCHREIERLKAQLTAANGNVAELMERLDA